MTTISRGAFMAAGTAAVLVPRSAFAADPTPVKLIGFLSSSSLPYFIAADRGFFTRENLAVTLTQTPGSVYQFQHLSSGDFDVATTAIDNIIAYDEGQGEAALANPADFVAFLGGDSGFLQLWARPEIKTLADLRGKTLAVDALTTGYAFILYRMLQTKAGLTRADYSLDGVGGTRQRLDAIVKGPDAAGLLTPPFDTQARAAGMNFLGSATDVIGASYQASCLVARRPWLAANADTAVRLARAIIRATAWMYDPANRASAVAVLAERSRLAPDVAAPLFTSLTDPKHGFDRNAAIDVEGMRTVLELRSAYGAPKKTLTDASRYYDLTFEKRARATLG